MLTGNRILVMGGPGSGKTTLARDLSRSLEIAVTELDDIFWCNENGQHGIRRDAEVRASLLSEATAASRWILEGVYWSWTKVALEQADQIIFLDTPRGIRHFRLVRRHIRRRLGFETNTHRETTRDAMELIAWNHRWDRDNRTMIMALLDAHQAKITILKNTRIPG